MPALPLSDVTAIVLVGGQGRRMAGQDKGLVEMHGKPLIAHVLERVTSQVTHILINANRNHDRYAAFGYPVVSDEVEGFVGPLAGIHAGMGQANTDWVFSLPCDTPFFPQNIVPRLYESAQQSGAQVAVACAGGREQPVFMLAQRRLRDSLASYLASGERKIDKWYNGLGGLGKNKVAKVTFTDAPAFANINTSEELHALQQNMD